MAPSEVTVGPATAPAPIRHLAGQKVESESGQQPVAGRDVGRAAVSDTASASHARTAQEAGRGAQRAGV